MSENMYNINIERAVLSAIIFDPQIFEEIASKLEANDFYLSFHKHLFIAMDELNREDKPIDEEFLATKLKVSKSYDELGLLEVMSANAISDTNSYIEEIKSRSTKRALSTLATTIKKVTVEDNLPTDEIMNLVEKKLYEITQNSISEDFRESKEITLSMLEEINRLKELGNSKLLGTDTGFKNLNDKTSGFGKGDLVIIAARPAMGKCLGKGTKVLMYSGAFKKVEDIEVGELLMGDDSTPRKVLSLARGREEMYWVRQQKGMDYRVNKSHILSLKSLGDGANEGVVFNISISDYLEKSDAFKANYQGYKAKLDFSKLSFNCSERYEVKRGWERSSMSVEYDRVDDYYGFEIDGNRLFVLEDMTVTHNTSLVLNITQKAIERGEGVAFFSLEMPGEQLMLRLLSTETSIPLQKLRVGDLTDEEWSRLARSADIMSSRKLFVDDGGYATIHHVRSKLRKLKSQHPEISLAVIDYLQLMSGESKDGRQQVISEISRGLKQLARELQIPILALSQLNRGVESRDNKRPMLSDLRESGCLAGDSLIIDSETGSTYRMDELAENKNLLPLKTKSMDRDLTVKNFTIINAFCSGEKLTYRLTTKLGRTIKATANHKFYRVDGWIRLDGLRVGDTIATADTQGLYKKVTDPAFSEICWDEIVSIDEHKKEKTYDLTVESVHNFIANDIIVHNSIEQDADIVMFVYRDDVYREAAEKEKEMKAKSEGKDYENTFEKKLEEDTELIIGKHRNGPTGTVKLIFQKQFTRFVDANLGDNAPFEVVYEENGNIDTRDMGNIDVPVI